MMDSDEEEEERAGGNADRVKETIAQQIFEGDADDRAPPTPADTQQTAQQKRAAREREREQESRQKDALLVRGDDEEEEDEDEEADENDMGDFIVDESGRPVSEKHRRRQVMHDDAALQEAQDIFGIDFDFDEADENDKEGSFSPFNRSPRNRLLHLTKSGQFILFHSLFNRGVFGRRSVGRIRG